MAELLGMNPERVLGYAGQLRTQTQRLNAAATKLNRAATASVSPQSWGIQPGGFIIAPWDIGQVRAAASRVSTAAGNVDALANRLEREANEQLAASEEKKPIGRPGIGKKPRERFEFPEWIDADWWGATAWLGYLEEIKDIMENKVPKSWVFGRMQWVNRASGGYWRFKVGLLQWGSSTYKNAKVALVYRSIPNVKWTSLVGKIPPWVGKVGKVAGPVGTIIGAGIDGYEAWNEQWDKSSDLPDGERHLRSAAAVATVGGLSLAGGLAGAAGGAALGAAIGSIFPGPGNVIGGIVGGIIGGVVGSGLGEAAGKWFNSLW
jgi:hypothetical protein